MSDPITREVTSYVVFCLSSVPQGTSKNVPAVTQGCLPDQNHQHRLWIKISIFVMHQPNPDHFGSVAWTSCSIVQRVTTAEVHTIVWAGIGNRLGSWLSTKAKCFRVPLNIRRRSRGRFLRRQLRVCPMIRNELCQRLALFILQNIRFEWIPGYMECWYWCRGWKEGKGAYRLNPLRLKSANICLRRLLICKRWEREHS